MTNVPSELELEFDKKVYKWLDWDNWNGDIYIMLIYSLQ